MIRNFLLLIGIFATLPSYGNVVFEAEYWTLKSGIFRDCKANQRLSEFEMPAISGASSDAFVTVPQGVGKPPKVSGEITYSFFVPEDDTYYLWARVWWIDGCGNSLTIQIDDTPPFTFGQDGTYKRWHWFQALRGLPQLNLQAGLHTLTISAREDGVAIDQIMLTRQKRRVPMGKEEVTVGKHGRTPHPVIGE